MIVGQMINMIAKQFGKTPKSVYLTLDPTLIESKKLQ